MLSFITLAVLAAQVLNVRSYTWPSPKVDYMDEILFQQSGLLRQGFRDGVTPCSFFSGGSSLGRMTSAEWLRTGFHDMATHNKTAGTGGLDASIMFETERAENPGDAFNSTFAFSLGYYTIHSSMADLIALSVHVAVRACGGPSIPLRVGRIDATEAGPEGVPEPTHDLETITARFATAGFNTSDMIKMVACGHTLGGVHSSEFPEITGNDNATHTTKFDDTDSFDEVVVSGYLHGNTSNPLVVGPDETNSDTRVFAADGNVTMKALANATAFQDSCRDILARMIDTVPSNVELTEPLEPIAIKPRDIQLTLNPNGTLLLEGRIRVLVTGRTDRNLTVSIPYARRDGSSCAACTLTATRLSGPGGSSGNGFNSEFYFYDFSTTLDAGVSHFNVSIATAAGVEEYDNGGAGFPIDDSVLLQTPQSCLIQELDANGNWNLTAVAAVHSSRASGPITLDVVEQVPRQGVMVPLLDERSVPMKPWTGPIGSSGYTLYTGTYSLPIISWATTFSVTSGTGDDKVSDSFKKTLSLADRCGAF